MTNNSTKNSLYVSFKPKKLYLCVERKNTSSNPNFEQLSENFTSFYSKVAYPDIFCITFLIEWGKKIAYLQIFTKFALWNRMLSTIRWKKNSTKCIITYLVYVKFAICCVCISWIVNAFGLLIVFRLLFRLVNRSLQMPKLARLVGWGIYSCSVVESTRNQTFEYQQNMEQ